MLPRVGRKDLWEFQLFDRLVLITRRSNADGEDERGLAENV